MSMFLLRWSLGAVLTLALIPLAWGAVAAEPVTQENNCFACHSDPAKLIPAIREVMDCAEAIPVSGASEGEG